MSVLWKIEYGAVTKTLAAWGVTRSPSPTLSFTNQGLDTFTFTIGQKGIDDDFDFAAESILKLYREEDGVSVKYFEGRVMSPSRIDGPAGEAHQYEVVGPWFDLLKIVFQYGWKFLSDPNDAESEIVSIPISHLIMNLGNDGIKVGTRTQLQTILNWAISCGANIQFDHSEFPSIELPISELRDRSCAEAVTNQLRWMPDAVVSFDYSTSPPTVNVLRQATFRTINLALTDTRLVSQSFKPRYDLQVPAVVIKYQQTSEINGLKYGKLDVRKYPTDATGTEFGALVASVNLEGAILNYLEGTIETELLAHETEAWWTSRVDWLAEDSIEELSISGVTRSGADPEDYPRELKRGTYAAWMRGVAREETFKALASFKIVRDGVVVATVVDEPILHKCITTDRTTGTYYSTSEFVAGEDVPTGLETAIYQSLNKLHYDGQLVLHESECTGSVRIGDVINLTGSRAEYATMNAVVQQVTENLETGQTTIITGPPKHLGISEIIEYLRQTRTRIRYTATSAMTSGLAATGSKQALGTHGSKDASQSGKGKLDKQVIGTNLIIDIADNPLGKEVKLREVAICVEDPVGSGTFVQKKMLLWCSEIYT